MLSRIPSWIKNRYVLTVFAFVLWILFFDRNDIFTQMERARDLRALEKFAREKYRMKKDNEDEYEIEDPSPNK